MFGVQSVEIDFANELKDGQFRDLVVEGEKKVLIAKSKGKLYATGSQCPHFNLNFTLGTLLFDDKIICPAHGAAFDIKTGYLENGPLIDGINTFEI